MRTNPCFAPTHWTIVRRAADRHDPGRRAALEALIEGYWSPVHAFIRRRGHTIEDARDLTQAFFTRLLETDGLAGVDPGRGRFRGYLAGAVRHFLSDEADRAAALKRGGGRAIVSFDAARAGCDCAWEPADRSTPAEAFDRAWAMGVLGRALESLGRTLAEEGRSKQHQVLLATLRADRPTYREIARDLGLTEADVNNYLHRARRRLRQEILSVVLETVSTVAEAEAELIELFGGSSKGRPADPSSGGKGEAP